MKKQYPMGAIWKARMKGVLYEIIYDNSPPFGMVFCVYIMKEDGSMLNGTFWENCTHLTTLRAATKFCRDRYYLPLRFRRVG
jgi:hypothetical protein